MDKNTIDSYNKDAKNIAQLHSTLIPERLYQLVEMFFIKDENTADIGCGIGRDTHWLNQRGYPSIGIDASIEMLNEAQDLYPKETFTHDFLPNLDSLVNTSFHNILCSAVLMHISQENLALTYGKLLNLLEPNGVVIISFRGTNSIDYRENGKLYEPISTKELINFFEIKGCQILLNESEVETKRNLTWHNIVIKK